MPNIILHPGNDLLKFADTLVELMHANLVVLSNECDDWIDVDLKSILPDGVISNEGTTIIVVPSGHLDLYSKLVRAQRNNNVILIMSGGKQAVSNCFPIYIPKPNLTDTGM